MPPKLKQVVRLDSIKLDQTYFTDEGYLIDHPIVTSCGIFEYTNPDGTTRRELRLPEHVFDKKSLASYEGKPVIITHEAGEVDKDNVDQEIIGTILSKGYRDGSNVRAKIIIHDTDAMQESGLRELSLGYGLVLDETPGVWHGEPYDAVQTEIDINHLALVRNARAGEQARLNIDGYTPPLKGVKKTMKKKFKGKGYPKTRRRDGGPMTAEELEAAVQAYHDRRDQRLADSEQEDEENAHDNSGESPAQDSEGMNPVEIIELVKDRRDRRDSVGDPETVEEALAIIAHQDEDIGTLLEAVEVLAAQADFDSSENEDEENEDECEHGDEENEDSEENEDEENDDEDEHGDESGSKAGAMNADSIDRLVRTRVELVRIGDSLRLDGIDKMGIAQAKKAIIKKVRPGLRLDGKSNAYINAAFDLAVETLKTRKKNTNYQRGQMFNADSAGLPTGKTAAERSRERMIKKQNGGK